MTKNYPGEQWKAVKFKFNYTNDFQLEVSNFGRVRSFGKFTKGNILKGSMINGYSIIRLKFFKARDKNKQQELDSLKQRVFKLTRQLTALKKNKASKAAISEATARLDELKKSVSKKFKQDEKARTIYYHSLVHRLVADYFLARPAKKQVVVGHLDHNKLNNRSSNLRWMTAEENYAHQKKSPIVIAQKKERANGNIISPTAKLTVTKVMLLKKLLNQDKSVRQLAKQFKVTDTQIIRIRKGENWGRVKAAR